MASCSAQPACSAHDATNTSARGDHGANEVVCSLGEAAGETSEVAILADKAAGEASNEVR
jgi:hypothetical protein